VAGGWVAIEADDNPSVDDRVEEAVLEDDLDQVVGSVLCRLLTVTG
jgi:hypothetical protein